MDITVYPSIIGSDKQVNKLRLRTTDSERWHSFHFVDLRPVGIYGGYSHSDPGGQIY